MLWHLLVTQGERFHELVAWVPRASGLERLPPEITDLLASLELMRDAGTPPAGPTPAPASLMDRGRELASRKDWSGAIAAYTAALELEPRNETACRDRGGATRSTSGHGTT